MIAIDNMAKFSLASHSTSDEGSVHLGCYGMFAWWIVIGDWKAPWSFKTSLIIYYWTWHDIPEALNH